MEVVVGIEQVVLVAKGDLTQQHDSNVVGLVGEAVVGALAHLGTDVCVRQSNPSVRPTIGYKRTCIVKCTLGTTHTISAK
jgi:hypothetical protein